MRFFLFVSILIYFLSCSAAPDFSDVPKITFVGLSKSEMIQDPIGTLDSVFITMDFEDGNGDIGENGTVNIFIIDDRTGKFYEGENSGVVIPMLPEQGASNGISGQITFKLFTTCCVFPDNIPPCEAPPEYPSNELILSIYLKDRAGNQSNTITTNSINLLCQ